MESEARTSFNGGALGSGMVALLLGLLALGCGDGLPEHEEPTASRLGLVPQRVDAAIRRSTQRLVHVATEGEEIVVTPEHPFAVASRGWVMAGALRTGDLLVSGERDVARVASLRVEELVEPIEVFNLTVAKSHAYLVGAPQLLVHNANCGSPSGSSERSSGERTAGARSPGEPPSSERTAESRQGEGAERSRGIVTRSEEARRAQIEEQIARAREKVKEQLAHYDEITRLLAREYRDGRITPDAAERERFDKLNEEIDNLHLAILDRTSDGEIARMGRAVNVVKRMEDVKGRGKDLIAARADTILPLVKEIDTLNYLVQDRLDRLAEGYSAEVVDGDRFRDSHESGVGTTPSLRADFQHTLNELRQQIDRARAETKVETAMVTLLGGALLAEIRLEKEGFVTSVRDFFSTKQGALERTEKSAEKRQQELEQRFGDLYDVKAEDGEVRLGIKPEAPGAMTIPELANRMDGVLAEGEPPYLGRAVRAAVDAHPDFEIKRDQSGKKRDRVVVPPARGLQVALTDTFTRLGRTRVAAAPLPPRERLLQAGLTAHRSIKVNDLKFSITRDARAAIDAEYHKSNNWLNSTPGLTREKVELLTRTVDVIVLCNSAAEMSQAIQEAKRQHAELLREWHNVKGGKTAKALERWATMVRTSGL